MRKRPTLTPREAAYRFFRGIAKVGRQLELAAAAKRAGYRPKLIGGPAPKTMRRLGILPADDGRTVQVRVDGGDAKTLLYKRRYTYVRRGFGRDLGKRVARARRMATHTTPSRRTWRARRP